MNKIYLLELTLCDTGWAYKKTPTEVLGINKHGSKYILTDLENKPKKNMTGFVRVDIKDGLASAWVWTRDEFHSGLILTMKGMIVNALVEMSDKCCDLLSIIDGDFNVIIDESQSKRTTTTKNDRDYEGFMLHIEELEEIGIPNSFIDLTRLAKKYNVPIPKGIVVDGKITLVWGMHDRWDWSTSDLQELSEEELFDLYVPCKNSWK